MTQEPELPALPARFDVVTRANPDSGGYVDVPVYSGDDLRAYATAAVLAERERCARCCDEIELDCRDRLHSDRQAATAYMCAATIRTPPAKEPT